MDIKMKKTKTTKRKTILEPMTYAYIRRIKKWMFCLACQNGKMTINKKSTLWTCEECGKLLPDSDATLCVDCKLARKQKAKEGLKTAGKVVGVASAVAGAVYLASQASGDDEGTGYLPLPDGDNDDGELMGFDYVTDYWMETASEDELRETSDQIQAKLNKLDYNSDEHTKLSNVSVDLVNAICSRFPLNLPHREHGWYLPNDD